MSSAAIIMLTGALVASAAAIVGCFLVLRRMAMMSDAISHAILPGLVLGYFLAHGPNLFAGFLGASVAAVITVALVEGLQNTRRVAEQSAIGLVFPAMFALGTFLISRYFANVHLDTDAVLYGHIEFAAQDLLFLGNLNLGPQALWVMGFLLVMNLAFVIVLYKELKVATFDPGLAAAMGFSPVLLHYLLMAVVSITAVGAFTAVGAVLTVALMIVPAAAAYLLTDRLATTLGLAVAIGVLSAVAGYGIAVPLDASIAGAMVTVSGFAFALAVLFSPSHGVVARAVRLRRQRMAYAAETLAVHLLGHEGTAQAETESAIAHLGEGLRWSPALAQRVQRWAIRAGFVEQSRERLVLTERGRDVALRALERGA
ncbi:MAG: metal ABC transporter permease [Armatimonadetes bacterium]|nr:metal ABC transporter permease [Armatimonadota bacterium]